MLHYLISEIIALFETQFKRTALSTGPLPESDADLPAIAVYAGTLTAMPGASNQPLQPRRVPVAQRFNLSPTSRGPFPLDHRPLKASLSAQVTAPEAAKQMLLEPAHFSIDRYGQTITFTPEIPETCSVAVSYDFTGLALVQEVEQALVIEVRGVDNAQAERLASIAAAIVLTASEDLARRAAANTSDPHAGPFRATHTIESIALQSAVPGRERYTLNFTISGQLKMIKEMV